LPLRGNRRPRTLRPWPQGNSVAGLLHNQTYCMNQPWLTTADWPLWTVLLAAA